MFAECLAGVWLAEISADLREAVVHQRRVCVDALYKWPHLLYFLLYLLAVPHTADFLRFSCIVLLYHQKLELTCVVVDGIKHHIWLLFILKMSNLSKFSVIVVLKTLKFGLLELEIDSCFDVNYQGFGPCRSLFNGEFCHDQCMWHKDVGMFL